MAPQKHNTELQPFMKNIDNVITFIQARGLTKDQHIEIVLKHEGNLREVCANTQDPDLFWALALEGLPDAEPLRRAACLTAALFAPFIGWDRDTLRARMLQKMETGDPTLSMLGEEADRVHSRLEKLPWSAHAAAAGHISEAIKLTASSGAVGAVKLVDFMLETARKIEEAAKSAGVGPQSPLLVTESSVKAAFLNEYQNA